MTDTATLIRTLEANGPTRGAAEAIASGVDPVRTTASRTGIVKWSVGLFVAVWLASVLWISNEIRENRGRIELLRAETAGMRSENGERFARIEALLAERLPPRADQ